MPSLNQLLEHTLLFVAARGASKNPVAKTTGFPAPPLPAATKIISDKDALDSPIWHWTAGAPNEFTKLTCLSRGMGNARMGVCDAVTFGKVNVTLPGAASPIALSFDKKFLVESYGLDGGKVHPVTARQNARRSAVVPGTSDLFPLEMNVDKSLLHVLVYDFPKGPKSPPEPTKAAVTLSPTFMPDPTGPSFSGTVARGQLATVTVDQFRIVVFVSLVCCKERADFDPGGLLGGARMIPHVMVMANRPVQKIETRISVQRPVALSMEGGNHDHCKDMNHTIESGLFADDNDAEMILLSGNSVPSPFWDDLFDAYLAPASAKTYNVVKPDLPARTVKGAVQKLGDTSNLMGGDAYEAHDIRRVRRQGAFDNIHVAPSMKITDVSYPTIPKDILGKVYMAPFCEHDCLHTHWRWGEFTPETQNKGWSTPSPSDGLTLFPGKPHTTIGAPMVPENQQIDIEIKAPNSFDYVVKVEGKLPISAGTYTVINHHGSAYAVAVIGGQDTASKLDGAKAYVKSSIASDTSEEALSLFDFSNEKFYWHLRYGLYDRSKVFQLSQLNPFEDLPPPDYVAKERVIIVDLAKVLGS